MPFFLNILMILACHIVIRKFGILLYASKHLIISILCVRVGGIKGYSISIYTGILNLVQSSSVAAKGKSNICHNSQVSISRGMQEDRLRNT